MENNYILYVGMDASKGKADAAILKVCDRRSVKPKFLRKKLSFKFVKSEVTSFLDTVRSYSDDNCTSICFALEVTGIYSTNVYNFIKANLNDNESIRFLNTDFVNQWRQFRTQYQGDPRQQIQQMLQSGQITQEQLNRAQQLAQQFIRLIPRQ